MSLASAAILNYIEFRLIYVIENCNWSKLRLVRDLVSSRNTAFLLMFLAQEQGFLDFVSGVTKWEEEIGRPSDINESVGFLPV